MNTNKILINNDSKIEIIDIYNNNPEDAIKFFIQNKHLHEINTIVLPNAIINNYTDIFNILIESCLNINYRYKDNSTFLHVACIKNNLEIVKKLINLKININAKNFTRNTALHYACSVGNYNIIKLLIENGAEIDLPNSQNNTPLIALCLLKNYSYDLYLSLRLLIENNASVNIKNKQKMTPLLYACMNNYSIDFINLLIINHANIFEECYFKGVLYFINFYHVNLELTQHFINLRININKISNSDGNTILHEMCSFKNNAKKDVVKLLLKNKIDVKILNKKNISAIQIANNNGNYEIAEMIRTYGFKES